MDLKKKISDEIKLEQEILSSMPTNNDKNIDLKKGKIDETIANYKLVKETIANELKERLVYCENLKVNPEIEIIKNEISKVEEMITLFNDLNSSFEKLNLDKLVYDIGKYYKNNLEEVNFDIYEYLRIFKEAEINLEDKDFIYSNFSKEYLKLFSQLDYKDNSSDFRKKFDEIYWKQPDFMKNIQSNFYSLFHKYEKELNHFVKTKKDYLSSKSLSEEDLYKRHSYLVEKLNETILSDEYEYFSKIKNKELNLESFSTDKIEGIYSSLVSKGTSKSTVMPSIIDLNKTLKEYRDYHKYNFIIEDIKKLYQEKDEKISSRQKLKEIKNNEKLLENKKSFKMLFSSGKESKREKIVLELQKQYDEYYEMLFKEKVYTKIDEDSKMIEALELASSYYFYMSSIIKKQNLDMNEDKIHVFIEELKSFVMRTEKNILSNLELFNESDLVMIISDKYILEGLNVEIKDIEGTNYDELIKSTDLLIIHEKSREFDKHKMKDYLLIKESMKL